MSINAGLMSSKTELWATPPEIFDPLNKEFEFTLDACALPENTKVKQFFSPEDNSLIQEWTGTVWMNPPYGREISKWMKKAFESSLTGATVVCLVPARTDTVWWWDYAMKGEIRFIKGRIKFIDFVGNANQAAPFPSAIVIFKGETE